LERDDTHARVATFGHADGFARSGRWNDRRRVRFEMDKGDGDWRIERLVVYPKGEEAEDEAAPDEVAPAEKDEE
jgi:hypothetical protein